MVVAIPLAPPVERHHEAVRTRERLEPLCRPRRLEHGVAKTAAHAIQHRGVREEPRLLRRQPRQELVAEVLGHEPVIASECLGAHAFRAGLNRQRRQVQAGRPTLRPLGQPRDLVRVELDPCSTEQQPRLLLVQAQVLDTHLVHPSLRPPAGQRQRRLLPTRDRNLRARRNVVEQLRQRVQTGPTGDSVQIVEHQHQRAPEPSKRSPETRNPCRPARCPWACQRAERLTRERLDTVNRCRDIAQEHHGVIVSPVQRDPRERTRISLGPPRKKGRLAVPGRRHHSHERRTRRAQPLDQTGLRHRAGPGHGRSELDLREVEGNLHNAHRKAKC